MLKNYNYKYSDKDRNFIEAKKTQFGLVQADLSGDLSFVPENLLNMAIVTQVFEHIPQPWLAASNLYKLMAAGGVVVFSVPFAYNFHPFPGDFWRYSPMGAVHLMESAGFVACQLSTDGYRALQGHVLGLHSQILDTTYLTERQSRHSLKYGGSNYNIILQKPEAGQSKCTLPRVKLTNELSREDIMGRWWPGPMPNFPFGHFSCRNSSIGS